MRKSGILLHPTSLPGPFGIGDLGPEAYRFADLLNDAGQRLWQILPLGPAGYGNSPYQSYSSVAGSPLLVSPRGLFEDGLLDRADLEGVPDLPAGFVDFDGVSDWKWRVLRKAARTFLRDSGGELRGGYERFCSEKRSWLEPYARFAALKAANNGAAWMHWRQSDADPAEIETQKFAQFFFYRQWRNLKDYCNAKGIEIIGDIPIFVSLDSADVWCNPELFDLEENGLPRMIAGVPPDYFSPTGQCWGNPLYRWDVMARNGYRWWIDRVAATLELVDILRIDHFRGFEKYYAIPGDATTAIHGQWVEGPGDSLFASLREAIGRLPFIAEDLGFITPEVYALRDRWGFPGMRVLQFAFATRFGSDLFKPHNFTQNSVVYTGTHDNDTTVGWFSSADSGHSTRTLAETEAERAFALEYLNTEGREIHWDFIRCAIASVADMAIFPMQDVLGLGSEARMNRPATLGDNWIWRLTRDGMESEWTSRLRRMSETYGRVPDEA